MVGTSKILTVSYGTFSCTLEGFDDSFSTMKAIAEYFRGLAADDRYFGAEPPAPDAEMLAKIAEREISRRVDAHMDDTGIVLKAAALSDQSDAVIADKTPEDTPEHDKDSRAEVEAARKAAKAERKARKAAQRAEAKAAKAAAEADAKAAADAKAQADAEAEAAAKLEADAEAEAAKVKTEADEAAQAIADEQTRLDDNSVEIAEVDDSAILSSVSSATAVTSEGTPESAVEEARDDAPSSVLAAEDSGPENTDEAEAAEPIQPNTDSVASKLQRIRAVVGNSGADADTPSDDLTEQFLPQSQGPDMADFEADEDHSADAANDLVADFEAHDAELDEANQADETPKADAPQRNDMIARVMARQKAKAQNADVTAEEATAQDEAADTGVDLAPAEAKVPSTPRARVVRMKRSDYEKAAARDTTVEADEPAAVADSDNPDLGLLDGADELDAYLDDNTPSDGDLPVNLEDNLAADLKAIEDVVAEDAHRVSTDDIVETMAGEAEVEVDAVEGDAEPEQDAPKADSAGFLADEPQIDDAALERLMNETDAQMQEPEGNRRRNAIAQLKAAVAAKQAAREVGEPDDDGRDVENAFRSDLSEAVQPDEQASRPRRPLVSKATRTERPLPSPLKLVAAQRVDVKQAAVHRDDPVVPRRVAATSKDEVMPNASGSFAEFADNMGAKELPELLEAAAAYTAFVEGADEFSRPQILRRVRAVAADDFNREDELRSFAELINAGLFTKVRNGRFQVADDSRYNPERRAS